MSPCRIGIVFVVLLYLTGYDVRAAEYGPDDRPYPLLYVSHFNATTLPAHAQSTLLDYETCPSPLLYVFEEVISEGEDPLTGGIFNSTLRIYGCCPPGTNGCVGSLLGLIKACCPVDTLCCVDGANNFMGCVREYGQCCSSAVCPEGYGCCENALTPTEDVAIVTGTNTVCCPLASNSTGADDFTSYCGVVNNSVTNDDFDTTSYNGCLVSNMITMPWCPVPLPAFANCTTNHTDEAFCGNETVRCPTTAQCVYGPEFTSAIELLNGTVVLYNTSIPYGCCPVGTTACFNSEGTGLFGCANTTAGEVCCGDEICPNLSKCCTTNTTQIVNVYDSIYNEYVGITVNVTVSLGCCPNELQCCQRNLMNLDDQTDLFEFFFCGQSHNGVECSVDMHREGFWFDLFAAQNSGLPP